MLQRTESMARKDPDWSLWHLAQKGSVEAFTQLRQFYRGLVRAEIQSRCRTIGHPEWEEVEQEVWVTVWRALPQFEGRSAFRTWLVGVTKNVLGTSLRRKRSNDLRLLRFHDLAHADQERSEEPNPGDNASVREAVDRLSESERQVITLRYFGHLADAEIAVGLHLPLGTVKGRIRRGLMHLRKRLR
jgi:RNA polymerase sigma-70 factor (ECF subfamily)